jgi:hypothetical protein
MENYPFYNYAMLLLREGLETPEQIQEYLKAIATSVVFEDSAVGEMPLFPLRTLTLSGYLSAPGDFNTNFIAYLRALSNELFISCNLNTPPGVATNATTGHYILTFTFNNDLSLNTFMSMKKAVTSVKMDIFHKLDMPRLLFAL